MDSLVSFWTQSWIGGDTGAMRRLLAPDVEVEWNLDAPVDDEELLDTVGRMAAFADTVTAVILPCSTARNSATRAVPNGAAQS